MMGQVHPQRLRNITHPCVMIRASISTCNHGIHSSVFPAAHLLLLAFCCADSSHPAISVYNMCVSTRPRALATARQVVVSSLTYLQYSVEIAFLPCRWSSPCPLSRHRSCGKVSKEVSEQVSKVTRNRCLLHCIYASYVLRWGRKDACMRS